MKILNAQYLAAALGALALAGAAAAQPMGAGAPEIISHRTNPHELGTPTAGSIGQITPAITYHTGPVMATPSVYIIWYGNWNQTNGSDTSAGQNIVSDFLFGLNKSPYFNINTSYGTPTGSIVFTAQTNDAYSQGTRLSDAKVQAVVASALSSHRLATDINGIYLVLTSSDVAEQSGFCTKYCGWHTAGTISSTNIKYAFIGNASRCLNACSAQTVSPNGNPGVDAMISVVAHELEEATTDPNPTSGWADANRSENADKCAWTFGQNLLRDSNGAFYNMMLPTATGTSRNFLVQRNLDVNSKCYVDYIHMTQ